MPNFKSMSFKMAVLQGGGQNLPSPCVCYPKDPMWNRVNTLAEICLFSDRIFIFEILTLFLIISQHPHLIIVLKNLVVTVSNSFGVL